MWKQAEQRRTLDKYMCEAVTDACTPPWGRNTRASDRLASQGFERATPSASRASSPRDFVVVCHRTPEAVYRGRFKLDNLPNGRVDLLARCASSAIFLSHGVRSNVRLWLQLQDQAAALCFDGGAARGMHPDERTLAAAIKRTLATEHGAKPRDDTANGWSHHRGDLEARLRSLLRPTDARPAPRLIQLHEAAEATLEEELLRPPVDALDAVVVLGDQLGTTAEEDALIARCGGRRARCSTQGLLTSHCVVLANHAFDEEEARRAQRRQAEPEGSEMRRS